MDKKRTVAKHDRIQRHHLLRDALDELGGNDDDAVDLVVLPPANQAGESDNENIDDEHLMDSLSCDLQSLIEIAGSVEVQRGELDDDDNSDEVENVIESSANGSTLDSLKSRLNAAFYQRDSNKSDTIAELVKLTKETAKSIEGTWTSDVASSTGKIETSELYSDKQQAALNKVIDRFQVLVLNIEYI